MKDKKELFIDDAHITIKSGNGGDGAISFRHEKYREFAGPDGGNGGRGGDVYIEASSKHTTLLFFVNHRVFKAKNGENGKSRQKHGKNGEDIIIEVPPGTVIIDEETGKKLADLKSDKEKVLVLKGGKGGRGNASFVTSTNQAPRYSEKGDKGKEKKLHLRLKLLADIGIVGKPNAGKSTLLSKISNAHPKIADYPFTTIYPNLGVANFKDYKRLIFADIPGLIEGASEGKGMGNQFLAHIERTKAILFLIDPKDLEESPLQSFKNLKSELFKYSEILANKPYLVVVNKRDLLNDEEIKSIKRDFSRIKEKIYFISALQNIGLEEVLTKVEKLAETVKEEIEEEEIFVYELREEEIPYTIKKTSEEIYIITGKEIERIVELSNFEDEREIERFQKYLKEKGIEKSLKKAGIKEGDSVLIKDKNFFYKEG